MAAGTDTGEGLSCPRCWHQAQSGDRFCEQCGAALGTTHPHPRTRLVVILATLMVFLGGGVAVWAALTRDAGSPATPSPPLDQPPGAVSSPTRNEPASSGPISLRSASASALCVSDPSQDFAGTPFSYEPRNAIDGLSDTAWRCDGDGAGQRLVISLPTRVTLTGIGLIPGYAKTDPADGTDRYAQNRRISAVEYAFDDGSLVRQTFDTSPAVRALQTVPLPDVSTSQVTITILGSVPGELTNGQPPFDQIAISEVAVTGR